MSQTASVISLTVPAKAEYLVFSRLVLTGLSRTIELDPETLGDLKLAVTEACSNAIRHAYDGQDQGGTVTIRYEVGEDFLGIEVLDEGRGYAPDESGGAQLELSEDGMGIPIIKAVVDEVEFAAADGRGTSLRFRKYLT